MKDKKEREPVARKPIGPQRMTEAKRLLESKIREIKSQESLLLFLFVENCSKILAEPTIELIWEFMEFLKSNDYYIINRKEVFCVPLSHLVEKKKLK